MHNLLLFAGGIVIGLIVAVPIGPVNLICVRRTLAYGNLNGFLSGLGAALGDGVFAAVSAFGLTAIAQLIEGYSIPLKLVGGLALIGFGVHTFTSEVPTLREGANARDDGSASLVGAVISTFALTVTNPATLVGFTALFAGLGALIGDEVDYADAAEVVSGVFTGSALWWLTLSLVVGIFHQRIEPRTMRNLNHGFGVVVTLIGIVVLLDMAWQVYKRVTGS
jgi:threonine/homoserine/homoserine lactone efflux protein